MKKERKRYTAEEEVAILRRHLLEQEPVSKLCDELGLPPTVFCRWQKELFENGATAFQHSTALTRDALSRKLYLGLGVVSNLSRSGRQAMVDDRLVPRARLSA